MQTFKIEEPIPGLFHVKFPNQYLCTMTMCRFQEFFESPYKNIRGKFFSWEDLMDTYASKTGHFTYDADWAGFNLPGDVLIHAWDTLSATLNRKEDNLMRELFKRGIWSRCGKFYVIATYDEGTVKHEIAHALFYLNPEYKVGVLNILKEVSVGTITRATQWLTDKQYCPEVLTDEIHAYLIDAVSGYRKWDKILAKSDRKYALLLKKLFNVYYSLTK